MRKKLTVEKIRDEVALLLNTGCTVPIVVALPTRLVMPSDSFNDSVANRMIPAHASFAANTAAVKANITIVKARWDMED